MPLVFLPAEGRADTYSWAGGGAAYTTANWTNTTTGATGQFIATDGTAVIGAATTSNIITFGNTTGGYTRTVSAFNIGTSTTSLNISGASGSAATPSVGKLIVTGDFTNNPGNALIQASFGVNVATASLSLNIGGAVNASSGITAFGFRSRSFPLTQVTVDGLTTVASGATLTVDSLDGRFNGGVVNNGTLNVFDPNVNATGAGQSGGISVSSLSGSGVVQATSVGNPVLNPANVFGRLTINGTSGTSTFAGTLKDTTPNTANPPATIPNIVLGVTKSGNGTQIFAGPNTYTGTTLVNGGVLSAAGPGALGGTSAISIATGGALQLNDATTARNAVNNSAGITLAGGAIQRGAFASEGTGAVVTDGGATTTGTTAPGLGALTLSANSSIDFNTSGTTDRGTLVFAQFNPGGFTLDIKNWSSSAFGSGNSGLDTDDRLIFQTADGNPLTVSQLSSIVFNGGSTEQVSLGGGFYEVGYVSSVPEPSTMVSSIILAAALGFHVLRRRRSGLA